MSPDLGIEEQIIKALNRFQEQGTTFEINTIENIIQQTPIGQPYDDRRQNLFFDAWYRLMLRGVIRPGYGGKNWALTSL